MQNQEILSIFRVAKLHKIANSISLLLKITMKLFYHLRMIHWDSILTYNKRTLLIKLIFKTFKK